VSVRVSSFSVGKEKEWADLIPTIVFDASLTLSLRMPNKTDAGQ